uniref:E3 ubiquitin-protein ligase RNF181 n=1 Tax=Strigamia maritima TaxID=126957 RepID=T1JEP0_STRMM
MASYNWEGDQVYDRLWLHSRLPNYDPKQSTTTTYLAKILHELQSFPEFEIVIQLKKLPCKHFFHVECILPRLKNTSSCPVCRLELPTDDPEYEDHNKKKCAKRTKKKISSRCTILCSHNCISN